MPKKARKMRSPSKRPPKKIERGGYQVQDRLFDLAKKKGYRSRAAFKLIEICNKFPLVKPGMLALDLGCAPGGWTQILSQLVGMEGAVIGVDGLAMQALPEKNITFIQGDVTNPLTPQKILTALGRKVDAVFSDMAPNLSGIKFQDHFNSYQLCTKALELCSLVLREGGNFATKIFPGEELETFKAELNQRFQKVSSFIPEATRKTSTEIYLIAQGFRL